MLSSIQEESGQPFTHEQVAMALGITRKTLSALLNQRQSVSPEMALRLSIAFPGPTAEFWLRLQDQYDLALARKRFNSDALRVFVPGASQAPAA